jgi:hypothetical protein
MTKAKAHLTWIVGVAMVVGGLAVGWLTPYRHANPSVESFSWRFVEIAIVITVSGVSLIARGIYSVIEHRRRTSDSAVETVAPHI